MKKYIKLNQLILLIIVLMLAAVFIVACENNVKPVKDTPNDSVFFTLNYLYPESGGYYLDGNRHQRIKMGCDGEEVSVVPKEGYRFIKWSDGVTTSTRYETNVQSDLYLTPIFQKIIFSVKYRANIGGSIIGETTQNVKYGESTNIVTAVAEEGYLFAGWSDGFMSETRFEKEVKEDFIVSAYFVRKTKILKYEYDIPAVYLKEVTLSHGNLAATKFYIPEKQGFIFDGWYLDKEFTKKVTDGAGYYYRGNTIFYDESDKLYPKWITEYNQTFKLLMIYVEESCAQLKNNNNEIFDIDYKMTLFERETCKIISKRMSYYLNSWFEDEIKFEVDTFFTTIPIGIESYYSFEAAANNNYLGSDCHYLEGDRIPEIYPIIGNYRSVITTSNMYDFNYSIHNYSGIASEKFAYIAMESTFPALINDDTPSNIHYLYPEEIDKDIMKTYLHEFAHTIEEGYPKKDLHDAINYYWDEYIMQNRSLELIGLYLMNKLKIDNEIVGIPNNFWHGNIYVHIEYHTCYQEGKNSGMVIPVGIEPDIGSNSFGENVPYGSDFYVQAIPYEGWRFVKWSDGITTAVRHDTNIISRIRVYAIFEKIE